MNRVLLGNEVLLREHLSEIQEKRLGLVANVASVTGDLVPLHLVLHKHPKLALTALFSPEHGFQTAVQDALPVPDGKDPATNLPVYSLYGKAKAPTPKQLKGIDAMLFDLQDAGLRFYTYLSTLFYCLRACARAKVPLLVLDRPNPLTGARVQGPVLDPKFSSFVGIAPIPLRHGMTLGELALYLNAVQAFRAKLKVIPMKDWMRGMWFDQTGLAWVPPSPNLPSFDSAMVYPATCLIEGTNLSEGRGTPRPFEQFGAPWVDPAGLTFALNALGLGGVRFGPATFTPTSDKHRNRICFGVEVDLTDRARYDPVAAGVSILKVLLKTYPDKFSWRKEGRRFFIDLLLGTDSIRKGLEEGQPVSSLLKVYTPQLQAFTARRKRYLLYA
jgi:uncharacterized protein YbbC (DUF1343 family)